MTTLFRYRFIDPHSLVGKLKNVCLTHVQSPHSFFVGLSEHRQAVSQMLDELNKWCQKAVSKNFRLFDFSRHTPCAARFSLDHVWYRARVESFSKFVHQRSVLVFNFRQCFNFIQELPELLECFCRFWQRRRHWCCGLEKFAWWILRATLSSAPLSVKWRCYSSWSW